MLQLQLRLRHYGNVSGIDDDCTLEAILSTRRADCPNDRCARVDLLVLLLKCNDVTTIVVGVYRALNQAMHACECILGY